MNREPLKNRIRQRALELGFDECRFASAAPPETGPRFQDWLQQGRHGAMEYLVRQAPKRMDPGHLLPGVQTMVVLAAGYSTDPPGPATGAGAPAAAPLPTPQGTIARYARAADYHVVLQPPLRELARFIEDSGGLGTRTLIHTDTGPVLEREFAQRAGLGFVGKHTNLISRRSGNWLLLAEILTTLALEPDPPETNRCGSCTRCLQACPTGALTGPFQLDARLCLAYLTIELKGPIPEALRAPIGHRVFGCDDCLEVCPWNRFARQGRLMTTAAREDLGAVNLLELLQLNDAAFRQRFRDTPLRRGGRRRLLRNVAVALGNVGGPETLPHLQRAATNPDPIIAEHASWGAKQVLARSPAAPSS